LTSLSEIVSFPARPKTRTCVVLATVGVPPTTAIAPPFTRIPPAALRVITIELSALSPVTVSTPLLNVAVVAALAGPAAAAMTPAASAVLASSPRAARRQALSRLAFMVSPQRSLAVERPAVVSSCG
jgi:hypothetical protein